MAASCFTLLLVSAFCILGCHGARIPRPKFDSGGKILYLSRFRSYEPAYTCSYLDCPEYSVVHEEPDYEIRLYNESTWLKTSPITKLSFQRSTSRGFDSLLKYLSGENKNCTHVEMTAPVVTSIVSSSGPFSSSAFVVILPVPHKWGANPPEPLEELHMEVITQGKVCIAVRKFGGIATDSNVATQAKLLEDSLSRSEWSFLVDEYSDEPYSIAQYNSPFEVFHRVNEIWVPISTGEDVTDDCLPSEKVANVVSDVEIM